MNFKELFKSFVQSRGLRKALKERKKFAFPAWYRDPGKLHMDLIDKQSSIRISTRKNR